MQRDSRTVPMHQVSIVMQSVQIGTYEHMSTRQACVPRLQRHVVLACFEAGGTIASAVADEGLGSCTLEAVSVAFGHRSAVEELREACVFWAGSAMHKCINRRVGCRNAECGLRGSDFL